MTSLKTILLSACVVTLFAYGNNNQKEEKTNEQAVVNNNANTATPDSVSAQLVAEGFVSPVYLTQPAGDDRLFVVDQTGQINIVKNGQKVGQPFLDIKAKMVSLKPMHEERGLLGLAFHPDFKSNGKFYVYYTSPLRSSAPKGWNCTSTIAEYKVSSDANIADLTSERIVLQIDQPQDNHNAGTIAFGPDGYLYISIGDGGGANDIDVNNGTPYGIPADNPFVDGQNGLKEIYAFGLRNPYRFSFSGDGSLIAADAGQELYEEIDVIEKGGNYGWNVKEGRHCFNAAE